MFCSADDERPHATALQDSRRRTLSASQYCESLPGYAQVCKIPWTNDSCSPRRCIAFRQDGALWNPSYLRPEHGHPMLELSCLKPFSRCEWPAFVDFPGQERADSDGRGSFSSRAAPPRKVVREFPYSVENDASEPCPGRGYRGRIACSRAGLYAGRCCDPEASCQ